MAAKNRLFSIARKPITCGTAFERVIIIRNASSSAASAIPSVPRVTVPASSDTGCARLNARMTSSSPTSIVVGMLISVSTSHFTSSRRMSRCRIHGSRNTLSASVRPADQ